MTPTSGADHGPRRAFGAWALVLASLACAGPRATEPDPASADQRRGTPEDLRALIRESAVAPVVASVRTEEEAYDPFEPEVRADQALPAPALPLSRSTSVGNGEVEAPAAPELDAAAAAARLEEAEGSAAAPEATPEAALSGSDDLPAPGLGSEAGRRESGAPALNPFVEFGERIEVWDDGRITKPFQMPVGKGKAMLKLMALAAPFSFTQAIVAENVAELPSPAENSDPDVADIVLLEKWDFELFDDFSRPNPLSAPKNSTKVDIADWMVVTAGASTMRKVESFIELFAARVPQVEITASILEVTFSDELDYGVTGPNGNVLFDFPNGTFFDSLSYSMPNSIDGIESVLSIGAIQDGVALEAFLEAIQRWENVSIKTNPRIVVREGGTAEISNTTEIPVFQFSGINLTGNFNASLSFKSVGTELYIAPRVMGSDTLAMNMFLQASQQIGTSVAFTDQTGNEFRAPLIATREARTLVYLKPGQAVAIGGLASEREEEAESKVPILGDLPLIGWLFKSVRKRTERTIVMFLITPRVLTGIDYDEELWDGDVLMPRD